MSWKRWLRLFIGSVLTGCLVFMAFHFITDPFGVFGDRVLNAYSYNMTQNPRTAKIAYLDRHYEAYDSYLVGCSKTSSIAVEGLNEAFGDANFYNMLMYGGDLLDVEQTCLYILEHYEVKNIVVNMGLEELLYYNVESDPIKGQMHAKVDGRNALLFYLRHLTLNPTYGTDKLSALRSVGYLPTTGTVFNVETGAYDKRLRDVEPVGNLQDYLALYQDFTWDFDSPSELTEVDNCLASIQRIRDRCEEAGVSFTLIISPLYDSELSAYYCQDTLDFFRSLADITPYWDFSGQSTVSAEPRYFYDYAHFRNNVGEMMLARMYGNDRGIYLPEDFGHYVTRETVEARLDAYLRTEAVSEEMDTEVPVLLYHHLVETGEETNDASITADLFEAHLMALQEAGYQTVDIDQLVSYVERGVALPEKPLLITFDDGYLSNLTLAAPLLRKYDMTATVFVIGVSVGKDTYKDTGAAMIPHFNWEEAAAYADVITLQSHTYDLHRSEALDQENYRLGAIPQEGEGEEAYIQLLQEDFTKSKADLEANSDFAVYAFAYPFGISDDLTEVLLSELGVTVTFTTIEGVNTLVKGLPQSLRQLKRFSIAQHVDTQTLLDQISNHTTD